MIGVEDHHHAEVEWRGTSRFEVVRRIGAGGMGIVYEAVDRETNDRVALKTLRSMSSESLLLFKNEFRAIADLRHPNLVSLGEMLEDGGEWFFTMDLVDGEHFLSYVKAREAPVAFTVAGEDDSTREVVRESSPPTTDGHDWTRLRAALAELAVGLSALHDANKVHCDIKPSNVLVKPSGQVVILDFGLVTEAADPRVLDRRIGTIAYMAPEQTVGERLGPAADWYAVGVVLYQALTGYLPVRGTAEEIASLKRIMEPPPPRAFNPAVPRDLDRLCSELLRIEASNRPSGREVLERLGKMGSEPTPSRGQRFVGRQIELATLRAAYDDVRRGGSVTVLLSGESGVGKSAITKRFASSVAASDGALVLRSRCHERESVPYKAIDGIVDAMSHHLAQLGDAETSALAPEHADVLGQVFPVLRSAFGNRAPRAPKRAFRTTPFGGIAPFAGLSVVDGVAPPEGSAKQAALPPTDARDPHERRTQLFSAMRELVAKLAALRPLVLLIDDLQWADADGLAILSHVMRPPSAPQVLLLGTVRAAMATDAIASFRGVQPLAKRLAGDVRVLELSSLPPAEARRLTSELLGESMDASAVSAIADEAGGHPLFIDELVRRRAHTRERTKVSLEDALWARIGRLDAKVKYVLEALVVAGGPIAQEAAARAVGTEFGEFARIAAELRAQNLARTDGMRRTDAIEPYHDRLRAAVMEHLSQVDKRAWHEKLAAALEASASSDPEALAVHFREAGDRAKASTYAARGADESASALAFDRAARLYRMALEVAPGCVNEALWQTQLGEALANAGRGGEAAVAFLAAARLTKAPAEVLDLRRRAAEQLLYSGHIDRALVAFDELLAEVDLHSPKLPPAALAMVLARRAELRIRGLGFDERNAANIPRETLTRIDASWAVGSGLALVDNIRGAYHQTRTLLLALEAGEPHRIARSLAGEVCFSSAEGSRSKARTAALHKQADALATRLESPYEIAWARASGGIAAALEGRWADALAACDHAEDLFGSRVGTVWEVGTMRWFSQWSLAYMGHIGELRARVPKGLREAESRGDLYGLLRHSTGLQTWAWLADGDVDGARERCHAALDKWAQATFHVEHWWAMLALRQMDLYEGKAQAAVACVTATWPLLARSLLLICELTELEALHLRARTALLAAEQRPTRAEEHLRRAAKDAKKIRKAGARWATPLADLLDAAISARRRDFDRAVALTERAAVGLDDAGMRLYAAAARHRRGELIGGDTGRALRTEARELLESETIRDADRFLRMLAPGFGDCR